MHAPWPDKPRLIGTRVTTVDGPERIGGVVRRPADLVLPGMLHAAFVVCPLAHARVGDLAAGEARRLDGYRAMLELVRKGDEVYSAGTAVVAVAADTAPQAEAIARAVKVTFEPLAWTVRAEDAEGRRSAAPKGPARDRANLRLGAAIESRDFDPGMKAAEVVSRSSLDLPAVFADTGMPAAVAQWVGDGLTVRATPGASAARLAEHFGLAVAKVISRGEGAEWLALAAATLARETKLPVKAVAAVWTKVTPGLSSSARVGGRKDGTILAIDAAVVQGDGPAVLLPPTYAAGRRVRPTVVRLNRDEAQASPGLGAVIVECAVDDFAAAAGIDPLEVRRRSLPPDSPHRAVLDRAAARARWAASWHPPGKAEGVLKRGRGMALHDWPVVGAGRASVTVMVYPDGSTVCDAPPGWRTAAAVLVAEALGIGPRDVEVRGSRPDAHPDATARSVWQAALNARATLRERAGAVLPWRTACARLGKEPIKGEASEPGQETRSAPGAAVAEVVVDVETGVVRVTRVIAIQEMGLIVERRSAEADVERGVFAAVGRALWDEAPFDRRTGRPVGGPRARRLEGAPRVETELTSSVGAVLRLVPDAPGVVAAVSNAVFNALGVRVTDLPLTPDRVLGALAKGG